MLMRNCLNTRRRKSATKRNRLVGLLHVSAASPWGRPPGILGDLSKCPIKPHQIPLGVGQNFFDISPTRGAKVMTADH